MDTTNRDKWRVRAATLVIFLLGAAAGTLAPHVYHGWLMRGEATSARPNFRDVFDRLQLNADQKAQVQQIFNDTHEQLRALHRESESRVREIRQQADERLQKVLTPEQWQRFQQAREETHAQRRHGHGAPREGDPHQAAPPPPPNSPAP
jgi:Spy/CpxP family protein refolding chaperone